MAHTLAFDMGKTNLRLTAVALDGAVAQVWRAQNFRSNSSPYLSLATNRVWDWMMGVLSEAARQFDVTHICVATHGATAALVHQDIKEHEHGLILPVMDYEWEGVREFDGAYNALRPLFSETYSPSLPYGLNLARQLYWLSKCFPDKFSLTQKILPYAQYWTWLLSDVMACEISAIGCHTDLWSPINNDWSSLVDKLDWREKFPDMAPAWSSVGVVLPSIVEQTGLNPDCCVLTGVHDSNASYARFHSFRKELRPTVVSTGTWVVTMHPHGAMSVVDEDRDMLANVDVTGQPVACARFMGGREYADICARFGCEPGAQCSREEIQIAVNAGAMALPDYSDGSGPYGGQPTEIIGSAGSGLAITHLYAALMIDLELDLLDVRGPVVIEGSFAQNEMLCDLIASLRPSCVVSRLANGDGIAQGCAVLTSWENRSLMEPELVASKDLPIDGLEIYRESWRSRCEARRLSHA